MAGQITGYGSRIALNFLVRKSLAYTTTGSQYLMALTAAPPDDDSLISALTELSATGYARQAPTWNFAVTSSPTVPTNIATNATLLYGPFTAVTGSGASPVVALALVEAASGTSPANVVMTWILDTPASAAQGESLQVPAGALVMGQN